MFKNSSVAVEESIEEHLQPTIIMATEKIFSPSVVGAMLPKPMVVRLVIVK